MRAAREAVRWLLISCAGARDPQFRGVARACRLLARVAGVRHLPWDPGRRLGRTATGDLRWVVVSGHGGECQARIGDGDGRVLCPRDLSLGAQTDLYLLACHQGKAPLIREWARVTGGAARGCEGETESALSTLFVLALLDNGPASAPRWFERWREANDLLRPHFPRLRQLYREQGRHFSAALEVIGSLVDLAPLADFLELAGRHEAILDGLG